ncbi:ABC transporter substrate-binding protein [Azospirillum sp.]|uniref:ABC transporter substrate-binding protein n=1 Tax=Azospirillum sp. TaxID=34012 RepID=UPI002D4A29A2|nr:ABC transporter substrate-binding protein [Azospirillum sp.]HYD65136.1 ABC transporter substrate-binding protein [Azospirillum sp.]
MLRFLKAAAVPAIAAALSFSTLPFAAPAHAGKADDTLNIAWAGELPTLDRYFNVLREGELVARLVFDSLLTVDPKTFEYQPLLASSYRFVDNRTIEFELRRGVRFHNGQPFDADDVVYTLTLMADPATKVLTRQNVDWIERVEKLGSHTVRIVMKAPTPLALEYLAGPLLIYPRAYYAEAGSRGFGQRPVGTGPYKVTEVDPGKRIVFEANRDYFADSPKGKPSIGRIVQRTIPDQNTQVAEMLSGGIDWIWNVPTDQANKLARMPALTVQNAQTMRIGYLAFDASNRTGHASPVNDPRVRRAIAHAIDRKAIVKQLVRGSSQVIDAACFPTQFGCTSDVAVYDYDPAKAKALLAEAGHPNGFEVEFHAYRDRPVAEAVIGYLDAVGIRAKLVYLQYEALREKTYSGTVDFSFMSWGSYSINDAAASVSQFFKGTKDDYLRDPQVVQWLETADGSVDPAVRKENYAKALRRIADLAAWVPMFTYNVNYVHTKDIAFTPTADEIPRFYQVTWK